MTRDPRGGPPLSARAAAARAAGEALCGAAFASDLIRAWRTSQQLAPREAAAALHIAQGAVRHAVTIRHLLKPLLRPGVLRLDARVQGALWAGAFELVWMSRSPVHSVVDEAVEPVRREAGRGPAGFVNAILRNLARRLESREAEWRRLDARQIRTGWDRSCQFQQDVLPPAGSGRALQQHLALAAGEHPQRFAQLCAALGESEAEQVAWASQAVPVTVVQRNALRLSAGDFRNLLRQALGEAVEFVSVGALSSAATTDSHPRSDAAAHGGSDEQIDVAACVAAAAPLLELPAFRDGLLFVQDTTAHAAARALAARPGERVLDLCAAPGGKSLVLAMQMQDRGEVLACDPSAERLARVIANVDRLGITCVRPKVVGERPAAALADEPLFNAALADVPCSNTGVISRRPEARLRLRPETLVSLSQLQTELLAAAAERVRPGGRVVYSTCSIESVENEAVVRAFLEGAPGWRLVHEQHTLPRWGARAGEWRDGGYWARLERSA